MKDYKVIRSGPISLDGRTPQYVTVGQDISLDAKNGMFFTRAGVVKLATEENKKPVFVEQKSEKVEIENKAQKVDQEDKDVSIQTNNHRKPNRNKRPK